MIKALLFLLHLLFISEVQGKHPSTQTSVPWPLPDPGTRAACPLGVRMGAGPLCSSRARAASPQLCSHSPRGSFPAQSTCTRQAATVTHGVCHKGKQIKTLTWDSLVVLFVLLLVLFVFFPFAVLFLTHIKFCHHDWGGGRQQHQCRAELPSRGGSKGGVTNIVPPGPLKDHSRPAFPIVHDMHKQSNCPLSITSLGELKPFIQRQGHTHSLSKKTQSPNQTPLPLVK